MCAGEQKCFITAEGIGRSCQDLNSKDFGDKCDMDSTEQCALETMICAGDVGEEVCTAVTVPDCVNDDDCSGATPKCFITVDGIGRSC